MEFSARIRASLNEWEFRTPPYGQSSMGRTLKHPRKRLLVLFLQAATNSFFVWNNTTESYDFGSSGVVVMICSTSLWSLINVTTTCASFCRISFSTV